MQVLVHAANLLFLGSYLVRDILKLRGLSLVAGFFLLAFYLLQQPVLWEVIAWNVVFSAINVVQIRRLLLERRPVALTADEQEARRLALSSFTPREVRKLFSVASVADVQAGERLVATGEKPAALHLILSGEVEVAARDRVVATLRPGQFVGEMSFLTGKSPSADALVHGGARVVRFDRAALTALLERELVLRAHRQAALGRDLCAKVAPPPTLAIARASA
ncbi:MAG: cyclic nucleotide-binding domain-containing protein [Polyangiaceae bacterium]